MNEPFRRLPYYLDNVRLDSSSLQTIKEHRRLQKYGVAAMRKFDDYKPIVATTYKGAEEDRQKALQQLPQEVLKLEEPDVWVFCMSGDGYLPVHVDPDRLCAINFYFDCSGEQTRFFEYDGDELSVIDSFVAEHGDCYLFNTSVPHDVNIKPDSPRKIFSLTFKTIDYDTLFGILKGY
jgi:hypothetical protein